MKMKQVFILYNAREEKKLVYSVSHYRRVSVISASVRLTESLDSTLYPRTRIMEPLLASVSEFGSKELLSYVG
jgi:hypothetical protein